MHIKVLNMTTCFAMHMMTYPVLVFKPPEVLPPGYSRISFSTAIRPHRSATVRSAHCGCACPPHLLSSYALVHSHLVVLTRR